MWEVATRGIPYEGAASKVITFSVQEGEREEIPTNCPNGYSELMGKCWDQNAADRPVIDDVLSELSLIKMAVNGDKEPSAEDTLDLSPAAALIAGNH